MSRDFNEDIVREHGEVGAARVALQVLHVVVSRVTPKLPREFWTRMVVRTTESFVEQLQRAVARGPGQRFDA